MSPEQYARRLQAAVLSELRHGGRRNVEDMPSPAEAAALILATRAAPKQHPLAERIGPVWSGARTREALDLRTRQALSSRRAHGTVLGITTTEGKVYYPVSQFRRSQGRTDVHPALVPVLKTLKDLESWTVAAVLRSTDPDLGMSPVEWAASGREAAALERWAHQVKRELTAR